MPTTLTARTRPPTEGGPRVQLLTQLAAAIRGFGGTALLALGGTDHPVLYVRHRGRALAVLLAQDIHGGWTFLWGRTGAADSTQLEVLAAYLADAGVPSTPNTPTTPNNPPASVPQPRSRFRSRPRSRLRARTLVAARRPAFRKGA